jgi:acyl carrier protein
LVRGADYARFGPEETYLFLASPSFDAATFEIWAPLLNGGKLVVMPPGTPSLSDIGEIIRTQGVTTLWLTARLFDAIVDEAPEILKPLRQLLTGGDTLSPRHVARCRKTHPDLILINGYGPTENTTFSCCYEIPANVSGETSIPIGKPIANSEALILDAHQQPVPPGSMGELYLGGDGLSLGYWKRDELNAQAFVPHPFSADPQDRLYRTGDLARYLPDGQIEFVGRIDHQVKIRGYRVELSEIETVLGGCPVIERCSVLAMDEKHGKSLAAALVPVDSTGAEEALTEAKAYLNENLPRHLQPDQWMVLTSLPLTPNGKLDRKALAQDFAKSESHERPIIPPNSPLEEQLLEIWRRLFQSNRISTDDSFFSLGGTSLTAMRLTWEVERELGRQLPISDLFRNPTIQSIGRFLSDGGEKSKSTVVDLREGKSDRNGLFIVHGWGGEVFAQAKFIKGIPADFPVYGVQAVELSGEDERLTSFEEMAKRYAKDIVARQPDGPYDLCGFSLGGMIAYETARELHRQGKEIGRLMVFDTHPKNLPFFQTLRAQSGPLVKRLAHHVGGICSGKKSLSWGYLKGRFNAMRQRLGSKNSQGESLPGIEVPADSDYYSILNDRFVPEPFPVPTTVFRAIGSSSNLVVEWQYLTKNNVTFVDVSSSHLEMFEDAELSKRVGNLLGADLT